MSKESAEQSESEIIERCKNGDRKAFGVLVARYQRRAYGIAYGMLRSREDALDAAQNAFVKVFRSIGSFKGDSSFYTWFYRIVVNVCIDHCRKKSRMRSVEYDDTYKRKDESAGVMSLVGNTRGMHPGASLDRVELNKVLNDALGKLSEDHRTIILLREVEGLSYEAIAESVGCHLGTVMSRLHHARKNLQKALKSYLDASGNPLLDRAGEGVRKKQS
ncbi:MAG: sigma-70 family RNA polymerase sigma factor [Myxococcota bacterium]|nr:sigma-70 family RNA polymerase sigma factor [Myxococcota bacterium]